MRFCSESAVTLQLTAQGPEQPSPVPQEKEQVPRGEGIWGERQDFRFPGEVLQVLGVATGLREWHPTSTTADLGSEVGENWEGGQHWKPKRTLMFSQKPTFSPKY